MPQVTPREAIAKLQKLIALDGAFFPCLQPCDHDVCELGGRVLAILEEVR